MSVRVLPLSFVILALGAGAGCPAPATINSDVHGDYEDAEVTVVGSDSGGDVVVGSTTVAPGECIDLGEACVEPDAETNGEWCQGEGGPVDLVVIDGEVVEAICYPPPSGGEGPVEIVDEGTGDVEVPQNENNTVVTFDESTDGEAIDGDINIEGNNVAIFGNGPGDTIIDGDITLSGNNVRLRGVTVTGNIFTDTNNVAISFCRVLGNVVLEDSSTNNSVIVGNEIHGDLTSNSNNHLIVANRIAGALSLTGNNYQCEDNRAFTDDNGDQMLQEDELGDELACE